MEVAAGTIAVIQITKEIGKICGKYIHGVRHAKRDIERLQSRASELHRVLTHFDNKALANIDSKEVQKCCKDLESIKERLEPRRKHAPMQRMGPGALKWPFTSKEIEDHVQALEKYLVIFNTALQLDVHDKVGDAEKDRIFEKLAYAGDALFNSYDTEQRHRMCLENTRVEVLEQAMEWSADNSSRCIFWLKGLAGTGKSTIASTVAFRLKAENRPVATFFFKRGHGDLSHVRKLIPTIVRQLSVHSPFYKQDIVAVIKKEPDLGNSANFREQFEKLLVEPLRGLLHANPVHTKFYIIMDALDECEEERDLRMLLKLMAKTDNLPQLGLKILVTTRPELSIRNGFEEIPSIFHRNLALEDVPRSEVDRDIRTYLSHELKEVQRQFHLRADWPDEQDINTLASKASGLFIFAATACRYIGDSPQAKPDLRLKQICSTVAPNKLMTEELDQMYTMILQNSGRGKYTREERQEAQERFHHIVGSIVLLLSPLPIVQLFNLLQGDEVLSQDELEGALRTLHAVIHVPDHSNAPVRPLHLSFRDFLLDPNRCLNRHFLVDEQQVHQNLVADCLRLLSSSLSRNICPPSSPGTLRSEVDPTTIDQALSPAIQYACLHWAEHAQRGELVVDDHGPVHLFLQKHFLHWLRCMSLMGMTSEAISTLLKLADLTKLQEARLAHDFILDCHRFTLAFRHPIEQLPEQVYVSALVFSPSKSIVRQNFRHEMPQWIRSHMTLPESWGRSLVTIQCGYIVDSVTVLDHGKLLATSGFYSSPGSPPGKQLDIWDPRTGDCQSKSLPFGRMKTICLSPDGSLVASVSREEVLTLWDVAKRENCFDWENRQSPIRKTAFSLDSRLLALAYQDGSVWVVDTQTGIDRWNLKDHSYEVTNLAFSPDATMLAIGVLDETIRLWDVRTGSHHSTLGDRVVRLTFFGYAEQLKVFSPDSRSIATSFGEPTVQLWSTPTGNYRFELDGHKYAVDRVGFSPNSKLLATSCRGDGVLFIWDVQNGTCLSKLFGADDEFSFSPDSKSLALGSSSKVRVWDIQKQTYSVSFDLEAWSVCFSPDGKFLASGSRDGTVRVWDMDRMPVDDCSVGSPSEPASEINDGAVMEVKFSPDGKFVASESSGTVRIWQSETGDCCSEYRGDSPSFSSDGRMVISASEDGLRLFDVGANTSQFLPTQGFARLPGLSPDGRLVAAVLNDNLIQVWDIQESNIISIPISNLGRIWQLIFSPTSDFIASGHVDQGPRIWDARTGKLVADLSRGSEDLRERYVLAFSPYSELLAVGRDDGVDDFYLQLWDIQDDACRITTESIKSYGAIKAIIFSPDGQFIAVSFWVLNTSIQLLNTETGDLLLTIPCFSLTPRVEFLTGRDVIFVDGIGHEIVQSSESRSLAIADRSCHISDLQIDSSKEWVTRSSKRVLWLPPDRRPPHHFDRYAVWRNKIAIGCLGGLYILTFDDEPNHSGIEELSLGSDD